MRKTSLIHYFVAFTARRHPNIISTKNGILPTCKPRHSAFSFNNKLEMASKPTGQSRKRLSFNSGSKSPPRSEKRQKGVSDVDLLKNWIEHNDYSYHVDTFLSPSQSYEIRISLVSWYRANRRKLPWRGDPGPYNGSTVGYAASASSSASGGKKKGGKKDENSNNKDIRSFFGGTSTAKKEKTKDEIKKESKVPTLEDSKRRDVTAYGVWVSEIMLQQTRVEAVIPYWLKWMESFPTVQSLANASPDEVNAHWAGLGFYRRARLLHTGAKRVVDEYGGIVPNTVDELMNIEGIGRYTASAIASIAYGVEVPVVDGNVLRVLSRLTGIVNHIKAPVMKDDLGWILAEKIVTARSPKASSKSDDKLGTPGEVNQAIMELGATYCSPAASGIDCNDPLVEFYASTKLGRAIGNVVNGGDNTAKELIEKLVAKSAFNTDTSKRRCRLCEPSGASNAFYSISDRITADLLASNSKLETVSATAGHACLPIAPPKKAKREEVLAVAVISAQNSDKCERRWLMIKRPSQGLLADQWEFPNAEVWNSAKVKDGKDKKGKTKGKSVVEVPIVDPMKRSEALDSYICSIVDESIAKLKRKQIIDVPITHVFSHVCHTMWIEHNHIIYDEIKSDRWKLENGREARWMTEDDMKNVGVTSGVKKILAAVKNDK